MRTGGGPPPEEELDEFEEGVAALLHPHAVSGHSQSVESAVEFDGWFWLILIRKPMKRNLPILSKNI